MHCENAYLIINPRVGQDMTQLADVFTILSAADWNVDNALVEYGGHARELAEKATEHDYDVIIGHGGDGTTNELVNAVMQSKDRKSVVAVLPAGTANQWPHEIGMPIDLVHAALTLINSDVRKVDVGRMIVESIVFPGDEQVAPQGAKDKKQKKSDKPENYFLLTAGMGIDASVISHTSKTLKEHIGTAAFDIAAAKELPTQHRFLTEIREVDDEQPAKTLWQGEVLQLILGNTRLYADAINLTPNAFIDDGLLDICIITANSPFVKLRQMASLVLQHKPDSASTTYVQGKHITITIPASIEVQLDGSALELAKCLDEEDVEALKKASDLTKVAVTYRFDVLQQALPVAIPRTYDNTLFANKPYVQEEHTPDTLQAQTEDGHVTGTSKEQVHKFQEGSKFVIVSGITPNPDKPNTFIIAGTTRKHSTDDIDPVAVRVTTDTKVYQKTGEAVDVTAVEALQKDTVLAVVGEENKRGVIQANTVVLP